VVGAVVELPPTPPQATVTPATTSKSPRQAINHRLPLVNLLLTIQRGNRRIGSNTNPVAAPGRVSVKTTVI